MKLCFSSSRQIPTTMNSSHLKRESPDDMESIENENDQE
jgi:hypothetical protein